MNIITAIFETPLALGSAVSIPLLLFIVCLLVKVRPMVALKTSFSTGFCMVGMTVLIGRFGQLLVDLATMMVGEQAGALPVADAGRRVAQSIAAVTEVGLYIMPLALVINIVMLLARCTRTVNIDIWSFWLYSFIGAMVHSLTGNLAYGVIAACVSVVFSLVVADSTVKGVEKCCALQGITFASAVTCGYAPIAGVVCAIVDRIPFKGRKDISFGWLQKRIGYFGDPVLIGTAITALFGVWCGNDWIAALQNAVQVGAYIFIVPKVMLLMADSLKPMAAGLEYISKEKLNMHGNLTIGLSAGVGLGNPAAMLMSVVMVPFTVWLAGWLPGNQLTPLADYAMLPYIIILVVAVCRGGILRSAVSCVLSMIVMLYCSSALSGLFTQAAVAADPTAYGAMGAFSSAYAAGNPVMWLLAWVSSFGIAGAGLMVLLILALALWNYNRLTGNVKIYVKKQRALRTFAIDAIRQETERRRELRKNAVSKKREDLRKAVEIDKLVREEGMLPAPEAEPEQLTIFHTPSQQEEVDVAITRHVRHKEKPEHIGAEDAMTEPEQISFEDAASTPAQAAQPALQEQQEQPTQE